jgi:surface polysaccharide O-acyltransferase-like enzyme
MCQAPTFVAIVQMWYRRREQTKRNASWYAMLGVVNIVSAGVYTLIV